MNRNSNLIVRYHEFLLQNVYKQLVGSEPHLYNAMLNQCV